jgi:hemolysin III
MAPNPPSSRSKPLLRGVSHQVAAFLAAPAAAALVMGAGGGSAKAAAVTYGASLVTLFAVSATYHRPTWTPRARRVLWRVDHSAIFLLIVGTYTPFSLLVGGALGRVLLAAMWIGASLGVVVSIAWPDAPKKVMAALYIGYAWMPVPLLPTLRATIGPGALALLFLGGFLYSAGAVIYALRRPDPFPAVFGFHEIFHLLVIGAAACHFVVVAAAIRALG